MRRVACSVVLLAACQGGSIDDSESDADTDADSDADTDADSDTDSDTDTDTDTDADFDLTVEVRYDEGPEADWRIGLRLAHKPGDTPIWGREVRSVAATGWPQQVGVHIPSGGDVGTLHGGETGAYYVVYLYTDTDTDGAHTDEVIHAVAKRWVTWEEGGDPEWYAAELDRFNTVETTYAIAEGLDLTDLVGADSVTLGGDHEYSGSAAGEPDRLATWQPSELGGALLPNRPLDTELGSTFEVTISGAVDPARLDEVDGYAAATELPMGTVDVDGSGDVSAGDDPASYTCLGNDPVYLVYTAPSTTIGGAMTQAWYGTPAGWTVWAFDHSSGSNRTLGLADRLALTVSNNGCDF